MITINYWAVLGCSILALIMGYIWYGLLFSKKWLATIGVTKDQKEAYDKSCLKLCVIDFLLTLFQVFILAYIIGFHEKEVSGLKIALSIWIGFIMPTIIGAHIWNNYPAKKTWTIILIQGGYKLVMFIIFGLILGIYRV